MCGLIQLKMVSKRETEFSEFTVDFLAIMHNYSIINNPFPLCASVDTIRERVNEKEMQKSNGEKDESCRQILFLV